MGSEYARLKELLEQLIASKVNLAETLVSKGEDAASSEPFMDLIRKAADYIPKSYMFVDEYGNEMIGILVDEVTTFTATENDVRNGKVFATSTGVKTGTKIIPSYNTSEGFLMVLPGAEIKIPIPDKRELYDYTRFQAIICSFNTNLANSTAAQKVAINDKVYNVLSSESIGDVIVDHNSKAIDLGIVNDSDKIAIIYYFTYKEIY